ncbi:MAG TPA: divalent metal cation transporter [Phenylobacterium sp.]
MSQTHRLTPQDAAGVSPEPAVMLVRRLGPGLITGAADDDPSGIATYSQAGAQFGINMLWTVALTLPLMTAIQAISARIGRVTGQGLAISLEKVLPRPVVAGLVLLLLCANIFNIGADLSAMGAAARLVTGWDARALTLAFAAGSLAIQVLVPYHRYVRLLKWLTMALFAYVGVVFTVQIDWAQVAARTVLPHLALDHAALLMVVAIFGTTISPYLFFWEASEEVEDEEASGAGSLLAWPAPARREFARIALDNGLGMGLSNLIAFFIILTTAVTLHTHGVRDIQTAEQAASALRPIAGDLAFLLFSLGVVGTGLLAVPVLAGSAAYAVSDFFGWPRGLELKPGAAVGFYGVIAAAVVLGLSVRALGLDPMRALFWSAVVNGVISVPIMGAMMLVATRKAIMGPFTTGRLTTLLGWAATGAMALAVGGMLLSLRTAAG